MSEHAAAPTTAVVLEGEWDIARRDELSRRMTGALESLPPGGTLYVDLTTVAFLDSQALSVLLGAHKRLARGGGRVVVRAARGSFVERTLTTAGLMAVLSVELA